MSLRFLLPLIACAVVFAAPARAQEASASKSGFAFPKDGPVRILVFRPDVRVGEQSTAGLNEPNADWTTAARTNIATALDTAQVARANEIKAMSNSSIPCKTSACSRTWFHSRAHAPRGR